MCLSGAHYSIDDYEDRIIEMAWEDRTPFEAIEYQFNHENKIQIMTLSNYNLAISDEEGKIMFFDVKTLNKRIDAKKDINEDLDRRNLLKKRLRALRK